MDNPESYSVLGTQNQALTSTMRDSATLLLACTHSMYAPIQRTSVPATNLEHSRQPPVHWKSGVAPEATSAQMCLSVCAQVVEPLVLRVLLV